MGIAGIFVMLHAHGNTVLAKKLAPMTTLPLQFNYDRGF
jgi:hypothetical protein